MAYLKRAMLWLCGVTASGCAALATAFDDWGFVVVLVASFVVACVLNEVEIRFGGES